jgi:hypothetical protein
MMTGRPNQREGCVIDARHDGIDGGATCPGSQSGDHRRRWANDGIGVGSTTASVGESLERLD